MIVVFEIVFVCLDLLAVPKKGLSTFVFVSDWDWLFLNVIA